jgi:restriction endonuclease S subunit
MAAFEVTTEECVETLLLSRVTTAGHGTKKLDLNQLLSVVIPVPPIARQREFAEIVNEYEHYQESFTAAKATSEALIRCLGQSYFPQACELEGQH